MRLGVQRKTSVIAMAALLMLGMGCAVKTRTVEDPALEALDEFTVESVYPIVLSYAREWQPDAFLAWVVMAFPPGSIGEAPDRISYEFSTPLRGNRQGWAWIRVYPKKGTVHLELGPVAETERPTYPLAFESAVVQSTEALAMAEAAGGKAYREAHPDASVFVVSNWWADAAMVWTVRYGTESKPFGFDFWIHAQTGKVL